MKTLLEGKLGRPVLIPDDPQLIGALGAALLAVQN
jgi:activator of 2-hydroxyglutaryl-CoA dehydratase